MKEESTSFIERVFGSETTSRSHFVGSTKMSSADIDEPRKLLDGKRRLTLHDGAEEGTLEIEVVKE